MRFCYSCFSIILIYGQLVSPYSKEKVSEDATLYFEELATKYGHPALTYEVVTEDGYILALHHLPGIKGTPVLLMHGLHGTSDIWMLRGNISMPIALANAGYDVWIGNNRGNRYSRRHLHLDPDHDPAFWNFSFHELGLYDLSAIIDTVLQKAGAKKINTIGHSIGNTLFYVLGSLRPEYNEKINVLIALAPFCYMNHVQQILSAILKLVPAVETFIKRLDLHEAFDKPTRSIVRQICSLPVVGYKICIEGILFTFAGSDPEEFSPEFAEVLYTHFPSSGAVKNFLHLTQLHNRRAFAQYDYGPAMNRKVYNSSTPPEYDLGKVTMPVAMTVSKNDKLSVMKDVNALRRKLPNVVNFEVAPRAESNHVEYIWGAHTDIYTYPYIFKMLERFNYNYENDHNK